MMEMDEHEENKRVETKSSNFADEAFKVYGSLTNAGFNIEEIRYIADFLVLFTETDLKF